MKDKFTMSLVWHNCKTYPPKEDYNDNLYVTDGKYVFEGIWNQGWFYKKINCQIPSDELHEYWWADLEQTVQATKEFVPETCESKKNEISDADKCECYREREEIIFGAPNELPMTHNVGVCNGTKEQDRCLCGGDCAKCDFYPHIRERAKEKCKAMTEDRKQKEMQYKLACLYWKEIDNRMLDSWTDENYRIAAECEQAIDALEKEYKATYGELPDWPYIDDVLRTIEELKKEYDEI